MSFVSHTHPSDSPAPHGPSLTTHWQSTWWIFKQNQGSLSHNVVAEETMICGVPLSSVFTEFSNRRHLIFVDIIHCIIFFISTFKLIIMPVFCFKSPRAYLSRHKPAELAVVCILFLYLSLALWPFQLYFIAWILPISHSVLLVLFCLTGPFNYISLYESLPRPWYKSLWLTRLKAPTK